MAKQIQVKKTAKPKSTESADAPTTNSKLTKLWFSGER